MNIEELVLCQIHRVVLSEEVKAIFFSFSLECSKVGNTVERSTHVCV